MARCKDPKVFVGTDGNAFVAKCVCAGLCGQGSPEEAAIASLESVLEASGFDSGVKACPNKVKQVIVLRTDLNMRKGKMVAQGSHACMKVFFDRIVMGHTTGYNFSQNADDINNPFIARDRFKDAALVPLTKDMKEWVEGAFTKACVGCGSEEELLALRDAAEAAGLPCAAIQDNGVTEFHGVKTWTALAVGPARAGDVDKITGHLKLL